MKVITTNLLNRFWKNGVKPIKDAVELKFDTSKILKSANITEEGFVMDGKTVTEQFAELNGKLTDTDEPLLINNSYLTATFQYVGSTIQFAINVLKNIPLTTSTVIYTLPEKYRPIFTFYFTFGNPGSIPNIRMGINTLGQISVYLYNNSGYGNAMASGSYIRNVE